MNEEYFHKLLAFAIKNRASDIHLKVGSPPLYRIDGVLSPLKTDPLQPTHTKEIVRIVTSQSHPELDVDKITDLDTSYSVPGLGRFRVNIYKQRLTFAIVMRLINTVIPTFESLLLPPILQDIVDISRGLILVTGATGSGKSSTLAAIVNYYNERYPYHILTIEDPIEFIYTNKKASISQREVGIDTKDFNIALRSALRQDPDVILIGEMRDYETVDIALKAAETGHIVLSTIHTPDCAKTIGRLLAMFPPDEQELARQRLADNLRATISQRLLPRADGKGRVVACEIMIVTGTVQDWLRDPNSSPAEIKDIIEKSRDNYGMQTFDQALIDLYRGGLITLEVAKTYASSPADLVRTLHFE